MSNSTTDDTGRVLVCKTVPDFLAAIDTLGHDVRVSAPPLITDLLRLQRDAAPWLPLIIPRSAAAIPAAEDPARWPFVRLCKCGASLAHLPQNRRWCDKCQPDQKRAQTRARKRAHKMRAVRLLEAVLRQRGICPLCNEPLPCEVSGVHLDHRVPLSLGGATAQENLQAVHAACNLTKGAKHPNGASGS